MIQARSTLGRRRAAHGGERKAKAADDALGGIGQRPVQIDEEDFAPDAVVKCAPSAITVQFSSAVA